jgi:hypothetical protein
MNTKNVGQFRKEERIMSCKSCQSENHHKFSAEIAIHFAGLKGLNRPIVWVSKASVLFELWFHGI